MNGNAGLIMLMQFIATLFGYGDLAEQTASQSRRHRAHMLGLLRYREAVAFRCTVARMQSAGMPFPALYALIPDGDGDSPGDALALAARFRALAVILMQLAACYFAACLPSPNVGRVDAQHRGGGTCHLRHPTPRRGRDPPREARRFPSPLVGEGGRTQ